MLHQKLLKLDFYPSLFLVLTYKINTLDQVGAYVSHQGREALPIPAFCFMFYVYMSVCVLFLIFLVRFKQHTHTDNWQVMLNFGA
jgi:hypothetical protein